MLRSTFPVVLLFILVASCGNLAADRSVVEGTGPDEMLKLRSGAGRGYGVIVGLPDGTSLNRHDCVTEVGHLWCQVSLTTAPQVKGYVSADYLATR